MLQKCCTEQEKKEEIWLSPMTKAPTPIEMSKGQSDNTNNVTKKFDYTAVADRLKNVHVHKCTCAQMYRKNGGGG